MAETTADVRRDIEMTRERMSNTLAQLEQKLNLMQVVKDHPWPAIGLAVGAGILLSGSKADVKAAAATVTATRGASSKLGTVLDDLVANFVVGVRGAFEDRVEAWVNEIKTAIGAPVGTSQGGRAATGSNLTGSNMAAGSAGTSPRTAGYGEPSLTQGANLQDANRADWQPVRAD
ncbi:MAG TPA: DUF3618 domain-containing protein [Gemmatimonadaceae bacterium]|nr:DUF3618 domain-containing protein [Gemmatimonadaceae bacterium]